MRENTRNHIVSVDKMVDDPAATELERLQERNHIDRAQLAGGGYPYAYGLLCAAVRLAITDLLDYPALEKCSRSEIAGRLRDVLARAEDVIKK